MDAELRRVQLLETELLDKFIEICRKEGLHYWVLGGTTIGAVRHKGFIPWDDDIDVSLPREDYQKFIRVAPAYLPAHMSVLHYTLDPAYADYTMKLVNNDVYFVTAHQNTTVRQNIWIDIFPIDGTPNSDFGRMLHYRRLDIHRMAMAFHYIKDVRIDEDRAAWKKLLVKIAQITQIGRLIDPSKAKAKLDREFMRYSIESSECIGNYMGAYHQREIFRKDIFGKGTTVPFEGREVIAPEKVHEYLTQQYGDYRKLPPESAQIPKHHILQIVFEKEPAEGA